MSRRKNGEGTIYRRAYKTRRGGLRSLWVGELTLGYSEGKRIKKSYAAKDFDSLRRAMNTGKVIIDGFNGGSADGGNVLDDKGFTVETWCAHFLEVYKRPAVKPSTLGSYYDALEYYINPKIGTVRLSALTSEDIQKFYNGLHDGGHATSTIKKAHTILSQSFNQAVRAELVAASPCGGCVVPRKPPKQSRALTEAEQHALIAVCPASVFGTFLFSRLTRACAVARL